MSTYHVELPGQMSLEQQSAAIEGEEALVARFVGLRLWVDKQNRISNLAEFEELDTEPDPPLGRPRLSRTLPGGATPAWVGPMIVQGKAVQQVVLLRDEPPPG